MNNINNIIVELNSGDKYKINIDREIIIDDIINTMKSFNNDIGSVPYGFILTTECFEIIRCSLSTEYSVNNGVIDITFYSYPLLISDVWCKKMNCLFACVNKEIYDKVYEEQNKIDVVKKNKLQRIDKFKILFNKIYKYIKSGCDN